MILPKLEYKKDENFKKTQITKLKEEVIELENSKTIDNELEEIFDIMQVCLSLLYKYNIVKINKASKKHLQKLKNRGWKFCREKTFSLIEINNSPYFFK